MRKLSVFLTIIGAASVIGAAIFTVKIDKPEVEIIPGSNLARIERDNLIKAVIETPDLTYDVLVPEGSTVFDLMIKADSQYDDFSFKGREFSGLGFFVEQINGLAQDKEKGFYWIYYVNGKKAPVGISQYKLKNNDIITWKYEAEN